MSQIIKPPVILVTGKNGQVGWELQRSLMPLGHVVAVDRQRMDLSNNQSIIDCIREVKPDIIVNAAAYTAVDKAEEEKELAMQINGIAPGVMAEEAKKLGALLVHYSTDYVFDGTKKTAYVETDEPNPINEYGKTKLAGERAIQSSGCKHLIFRTSWVYGGRGSNFLLTMLRLMKERDELNVIDDQHGTPTWCRWIAEMTADILSRKSGLDKLFGVLHLTAGGSTSWHGFALKISQLYTPFDGGECLATVKINGIPSSQYRTLAERPGNSEMSTLKLEGLSGLLFPDWSLCLDSCLSDLKI